MGAKRDARTNTHLGSEDSIACNTVTVQPFIVHCNPGGSSAQRSEHPEVCLSHSHTVSVIDFNLKKCSRSLIRFTQSDRVRCHDGWRRVEHEHRNGIHHIIRDVMFSVKIDMRTVCAQGMPRCSRGFLAKSVGHDELQFMFPRSNGLRNREVTSPNSVFFSQFHQVPALVSHVDLYGFYTVPVVSLGVDDHGCTSWSSVRKHVNRRQSWALIDNFNDPLPSGDGAKPIHCCEVKRNIANLEPLYNVLSSVSVITNCGVAI